MLKAYVQACNHMEFVAQLYKEQMLGGRYFLNEHPRHASSWELKCIKRLQHGPEVQIVHANQCQYGAEAPHGAHRG